MWSARPFYTFDGSSCQTPNTGARGLGVARERFGAGCRAGGRARGGLCQGSADRSAFQAGKQAENRDFREGNHTQETFKMVRFFPLFPPFWSARDRRGPGEARGS